MGLIHVRGKEHEVDTTRPIDLLIPQWNISILDTKLGDGVAVWSNLNVYGAWIGRNVKLAAFIEIQRDVRIGDESKLESFVFVPEGVSIGKGVFVGPHVAFTNDLYPRATDEDGRRSDSFELVTTRVEDYASIGARSVIVAGVTIGRYAIIGAGSVIAESIGEGELWHGEKARWRRRYV
jgi:acetyltransferase-like isoleucine patch superfamily enzyme